MRYIWYALIGIISGVLSGMGMGGGTILSPMLTIVYDMNQHIVQAINLVSFIPMGIVAVIIHQKNKLINFKGIGYIISSGCIFAILGAFLAKGVDGAVLRKVFGGFLIIIAIIQAIMILLKKNYK